MLSTPGLTVFVAADGTEVVGTATLFVMPNLGYDCHPTGFIEAVVVAEQHRRRGVGSRLIDAVLAEARRLSVRKVQLLSHKRHASDGAFTFYERCGLDAEAEGFRLYLRS
jgi:GNAT superfamily N-acetyltransferase